MRHVQWWQVLLCWSCWIKNKWSVIFSKSFVEFTKKLPTGSKKVPGCIRSFLNAEMKRICLIKAWQMKLHLFSTFCYDMDCEHDGLPHILIWVSYQKYWPFFFQSVWKCKSFFREHSFELSYENESETLLNRSAYISGVFLWLNDLDLLEQGKCIMVYNRAEKKKIKSEFYLESPTPGWKTKLLWHI